MKRGKVAQEWIDVMNGRVKQAFEFALGDTVHLTLPSCDADEFILETDWSSGYSGYMLFAKFLTVRN